MLVGVWGLGVRSPGRVGCLIVGVTFLQLIGFTFEESLFLGNDKWVFF